MAHSEPKTVVMESSEDLLRDVWTTMVVRPFEYSATITAFVLLIIALTIAIPLGYLNEWRYPAHPRSAWNDIFRVIFRWYLYAAGIRLIVEGIENLPDGKVPVLLAANHPSHLDGMVLDLAVGNRRATAMTAPWETFPWPLSFWLKQIGTVNVARDEGEQKKFPKANKPKKALELMVYKLTKLKKTMLIFPEGHLERMRHPLHFKTGAVRIALLANVPLHPVTVRGTDRVFLPNRYILRPGTIRIIFHKEFPLPRAKKTIEDHDLVRLLTTQLVCTIAQEMPPHYYTAGMVNACHEVLRLDPVVRRAIRSGKS